MVASELLTRCGATVNHWNWCNSLNITVSRSKTAVIVGNNGNTVSERKSAHGGNTCNLT